MEGRGILRRFNVGCVSQGNENKQSRLGIGRRVVFSAARAALAQNRLINTKK